MLPEETTAARLLREIRERDALFQSLGADHAVRAARSSAGEIDRHVRDLAGSPAQEGPGQGEDTSLRRAATIAKRLVEASRGAAARAAPRPSAAISPIRTAGDLGAMIRRARKAMKLSQGAFAAHAGVGRRFVSELESGKPSLEFDKVLACTAAAGIDIGAGSRAGRC